MDPFDNVVGLKPVDKSARLWVNDIPSVGNLVTEAIIEPVDYQPEGQQAPETPESLWTRVRTQAYEQLKNDLESVLSEKGMFRSQMAVNLPMPYDNQLSNLSDWHQYLIKVPYIRFTELRIKGLHLRPAGSGNITVRLLDTTSGQMLNTHTFEVTAGVHTEALDWIFTNERGLDLTLEAEGTLALKGFRCGMPYQSDVNFRELNVIRKINNLQITDIAFFEPVFEFGGSIDQLCRSNVICLSSCFQYLCSVWILRYLLATYNFNVNTNTNRMVVAENAEYYKEEYKRFLKGASATLAKQIEGTFLFDVNPNEVGGIHSVSYV